MKLFDDKVRTDKKPANHLDNTYDFFDRSATEKGRVIREVLNKWFDGFPENEKSEFKKRFRKEWSAAFYELFIHELFTNLGFTLTTHPKLANSNKRPDFLAKGKGIEFYIEVKEATDKTDAARSLENKTNLVYDIINKTNSPNFYLSIDELFFKSDNQPSARKVVRYLDRELTNYDPDLVSQDLVNFAYEGIPRIKFEDENLLLQLSLIPKPENRRGKDYQRPIGMLQSKSFVGGSDDSIKAALSRKATKYGKMEKPYLICINSTSEKGTGDLEVMDVLYGSNSVSFSTNPNNMDVREERAMNGFFRDKNGPKHTKVSAVMINRLILGHVKEGIYWFAKHPFAQYELDFDKFDLKQLVVENNRIIEKDGKEISDFVRLGEFDLLF